MEHELWMRLALEEARASAAIGEVPIGAVVVCGERVLGRAHNLTRLWGDPTAHAEMLAIRQALATLGADRLVGSALYTTLEPCAMCAGAMVLARVDTLVFGARDPKAGAAGSVYDLVRSPWLNHRLTVVSGVLAEECGGLISRFFEELRRVP
ncbi:MAG: tRNA adenosine(34) deaminase TadA [Anaerolineae bacterium]